MWRCLCSQNALERIPENAQIQKIALKRGLKSLFESFEVFELRKGFQISQLKSYSIIFIFILNGEIKNQFLGHKDELDYLLEDSIALDYSKTNIFYVCR